MTIASACVLCKIVDLNTNQKKCFTAGPQCICTPGRTHSPHGSQWQCRCLPACLPPGEGGGGEACVSNRYPFGNGTPVCRTPPTHVFDQCWSVLCCAVVYLLPHETSYVDFLRVRKIPLQQAFLAKQLPDVQPALQRQAETDRSARIRTLLCTGSFPSPSLRYHQILTCMHTVKFVKHVMFLQAGDGSRHKGICQLCACIQGAPLQVHLQVAGAPGTIKQEVQQQSAQTNRQTVTQADNPSSQLCVRVQLVLSAAGRRVSAM